MSDKTNVDFSAILNKFRKDPEKNNQKHSNSIIPVYVIALLSLFWIPINPITLYQDYPEFKTHAIVLSAFHGGIWLLALLLYFCSSKRSEIYKKYAVFACIVICIFNGYFWWNGTMIAPEEKGKIFIYNERFNGSISYSDETSYAYDLYVSGESFFAPAIKSGSKIIKISDITSVVSDKFLITNDDGSKWEALYRLEIDKDMISQLLALGIIHEEEILKATKMMPTYIELAVKRNLKELYKSGQYKDEDGHTLTEALSIFEEENKPLEPPSLAEIIGDRAIELKDLQHIYGHFLAQDMINEIEKSFEKSCQKEYKRNLKKWEIERGQFFEQYVISKKAFLDEWKKKEEGMSDGTKKLQEIYRTGFISYNLKLDRRSTPFELKEQVHVNLYRVGEQ